MATHAQPAFLPSISSQPSQSQAPPQIQPPSQSQPSSQPHAAPSDRTDDPPADTTNPSTSSHPPLDNYPHAIAGPGGPTATAPFLRDLNLVAEAAKRAQVSVMTRDLEAVTL